MNYTEDKRNIKYFNEYSATPEQIEEYNEKVRKNQVKCPSHSASAVRPKQMILNGMKHVNQKFYVIVDDMVKVIIRII